jgi:mRNA interferase MazF
MTVTKSTMLCSRNDIVLLPIPFTDLTSTKVRPAIVIGTGTFPDDLFVVPLTSRLGNADFRLVAWAAAGLNVPSGVKGQLATIERSLARKKVGTLAAGDIALLDAHLRVWLAL